MEVKKISSAKARKSFSKLLNQSGFGGDRIVITRKGKAVAAFVPMEDLQVLAELEDKQDIAIATQRLENPEGRRWSLDEITRGDDLED